MDFSRQGIGLVLSQTNPMDRQQKHIIWCSSMKHLCEWNAELPTLYGELLGIFRSMVTCALTIRLLFQYLTELS